MNFKRSFAAVLAVLILTFASGCDLFKFAPNNTPADGAPHTSAAGIADRYTADSDKIVNFAKNKTSDFVASDGYANREPFNCVWDKANAVIDGSVLNMSVTAAGDGFKGAEYHSGARYSYGYFSVSMKAAACSGVISSFFVYTGRPQWDEIDIEFLGDDTTKVQFNYYTNGVGGHEYVHKLGFDASQGFHEYGFDWQKDGITWYVDGKAIYKAGTDIPTSAGQIMANVWNGTGEGFVNWCGELDTSKLPATASYLWFAYNDGAQVTPETPDNTDNDNSAAQKPETPAAPAEPIAEDRVTKESDKIAVFSNGASPAFEKSNGWSNGDMFNCTWRDYAINFDGGSMNISVSAEGNGYAGGEYRSYNTYSFGYYSVSMQAAKCPGVVSSFFTYTSDPRWDEIDIEFLGKDTTKVQFNYYTNGVGGHEYLYDLGFDASQGFHEYGFYWTSDSIIWYVDGKAVYKATKNIPQYAGKIMTNVWNGIGVDSWLGAFTPSALPVTAYYKWIAYSAA